MANDIDYSNLGWVRGEIDSILKQASVALEAYAEDESDSHQLQFSVTHIHQVRSILQMLELFGASMLAEEIEGLGLALLQNKTPDRGAALELMMRSTLQLLDYLETLQHGQVDIPILLLPQLNDLRASYGKSLLSELAFFSPDTDTIIEKAKIEYSVEKDASIRDATKKLRPVFQLALLGWFRNHNVDNVRRLLEVLRRMQFMSMHDQSATFWFVCGALVESVALQTIRSSAAVNMLLGHIDRQLKLVADVGEKAFLDQLPKKLYRNILYYVAHAKARGKRTESVQKAFNLKTLLPDREEIEKARETLTSPAVAVLETVGAALKEDLSSIKDSVDLLSRNSAEQGETEELVAALGRMGDTMGMLGFGGARSAVKQHIEIINTMIVSGKHIEDQELMGLASLLLEMESQIDDVVRNGRRAKVQESGGNALFNAEYRRVEQIVLHECLEEIATAKEALIEFSVSLADFEKISDVPAILDRVRGAFSVMNMSESLSILKACAQFIDENILSTQESPAYFHLEALAEALSALEYQLEGLRDRRMVPQPAMQNAQRAIEKFGEEAPAGYAAPEKKEVSFEEDDLNESEAVVGEDDPAQGAEGEIEVIDASDVLPADFAEHAAPSEGADRWPNGYEHEDLTWLNEGADEEILEVFGEEAEDILGGIDAYFNALTQNLTDNDALKNLRRSFHTLKGSGRLAGSPLIGEIYGSMEELFNDVLSDKVPMSEEMVSLARESFDALPAFVARIRDNAPVKFDPTTIIARAEQLRSGKEPTTSAQHAGMASSEEVEDPEPSSEFDFDTMPAPSVGEFDEINPDELEFNFDIDDLDLEKLGIDFEKLAADGEASAPTLDLSEFEYDGEATAIAAALTDYENASDSPDPEAVALYDVFVEEAREHIAALNHYLESIMQNDAPHALNPQLQIATHTLAGSAQTASVMPVVRVSRSLDQLIQLHIELSEPLDNRDIALIADCAVLVSALIDDPNADDRTANIDSLCVKLEKRFLEIDRRHQEKKASLLTECDDLEDVDFNGTDNELMNLFFAEAEDTLQFLNDSLVNWKHDLSDSDTVSSLQRALHTLKGGARMTGYAAIDQLSGLLEQVASQLIAGNLDVNASIVEELQIGLDHLAELFEYATRRETPRLSDQLVNRFQQILVKANSEKQTKDRSGNGSEGEKGANDDAQIAASDVDQELVAVFMEEAVEVLDAAESELQKWKKAPTDNTPVESLQRLLHTLKGGARMAGFVPIGNLSHQMESAITAVVEGKLSPSEILFGKLEECYDRLHAMIELAQVGRPLGSVGDLVEKLSLIMTGEPLEEKALAESEASQDDVAESGSELTVASERSVPMLQQDSVRVSAKMIDRLVNYAGEISIYRSRFEQQLGAIGFNLVELEQTVLRLREQLRRLEIEAEAQIIYRYEEAGLIDEEFDPLEFDRFSQVQQLSRGLAESVSDLTNIQGTLMGLSRESEVLLVQQARLNTDLQESLMRSRMVPFSTLVPRLRRIVRQTAHELGKKAELKIGGTQGEMDRTVLDRVTAPLEHMLRNALAHGIESAKARKAAGKSESGNISVRMYRDGSEVVLKVADDGAGMKIEAIRQKALQRGLLKEGSDLSDKEVMQFVLQSGFSTADQISQIAGRGVGMDVVNNEIKQMSGSLEIDSEQGKGTTFTARLPFTLAVNQALLVQAGSEPYAIPLASIEGVVRVARDEVKRCESADNNYLYAGFRYKLLKLNHLLGAISEAESPLGNKHTPLLLVQTGEHRVALQVDGLMGSREIVVKSVGPQLSSIQGIMGATILGDGRVVFILDVVALTRVGLSGRLDGQDAEVDSHAVETTQLTAMVIDDSITMRTATKRLLERNNMKVVLAKDGVDAIAKLNEVIPDVMLLDVEMPRMDGFELAMHVRRDAKLKHIPIIMITSRSGEKHRKRAFDLGVNRYLGKPYQETELMDNIVSVMSGDA